MLAAPSPPASPQAPRTPPAARRTPAEAPHRCAVLRGACAVLREASRGDAGSGSTTAGSTPEVPVASPRVGRGDAGSRSTTAGSTPEPPDVHAPRPPSGGAAASPRAAQSGGRAPGASLLSRQVRKLFVGGVPQEMSEGELRGIFAEFAPVERVWLQRHRGDKQRRQHRGFGYVIFCDHGAVDRLLGDQFSMYLEPGDGVRLEAKRALSNREIQSGLPWSPEPCPPPDMGVASPCPGQPWQRRLAWSPDDWDLGFHQSASPDLAPACRRPSGEEGLMRTPPPAPMGLFALEGVRDPGALHAIFSPFPERPAHPSDMVALCAAAHGGPEALECALREAMPDHYED